MPLPGLMGDYSDAMLAPPFLHRVLVPTLPGNEDEMEVYTQKFHGFKKHMDASTISRCCRVCRHGRDYHYPFVTGHCLKWLRIQLFERWQISGWNLLLG
jgi:hypothetical protein